MECRDLPRLKMGMLESTREGFPGGSDGEESAYNAGDLGSIPGSGRSPGDVIHSSVLPWEIPWTEGAWWATVHGVAESGTTEATNIFSFAGRIKLKPGRWMCHLVLGKEQRGKSGALNSSPHPPPVIRDRGLTSGSYGSWLNTL